MKTDLSIEQFRAEIGRYRSYLLIQDATREPLKLRARFKKVAVNIYDYPFIVLQNDQTEATLRHIRKVTKIIDGRICTYIFTCNDYTNIESPTQKEFLLECV